jgi:hypothetical protein
MVDDKLVLSILMIPEVSSVERVDLIRDGGSYCVAFSTSDGRRLLLFSKIELRFTDSSAETIGFEEPVLIDTEPSTRPANTSNRVYSELSGPAVSISWADAKALLAACRPFASSRKGLEPTWFAEFERVVAYRGRPPATN